MIFDSKKGIEYFGNGPSMNYARFGHGCAIFHSQMHNYNPVIVVAGGDDSKSSEFWDFTVQGSKWELSKLKANLFH